MLTNFEMLITDFQKIAEIAGISISENAFTVVTLPAPHSQLSLPARKMAVYVFGWKGQCLKVGKAGPKSNNRYKYQHYNPSSAGSNLAKSLLAHSAELGLTDISAAKVGVWIKSNTDRTNFLLNAEYGMPTLNLLEAFLQCRLNPRFEGFESQRQ